MCRDAGTDLSEGALGDEHLYRTHDEQSTELRAFAVRARDRTHATFRLRQ